MKKRSYFKCPNALLEDDRLSYSARRIGCALFAYTNALGTCRKSYEDLARISNASVPTVAEAVRSLAEYGYITFATTRRFCRAIGGVAYGKNAYSVNRNLLSGGYTLVCRSIFSFDLTDAAFVIYGAILISMGNSNRAWPSITKLQKMTGAARSTVCAGLRLLKRLSSLLVQLCLKKNGAFAANSYHAVNEAAVSEPCVTTNEVAFTDARPSLHPYSIIKNAFLQGVKRIISWFGVVRNFAFKVKT